MNVSTGIYLGDAATVKTEDCHILATTADFEFHANYHRKMSFKNDWIDATNRDSKGITRPHAGELFSTCASCNFRGAVCT